VSTNGDRAHVRVGSPRGRSPDGFLPVRYPRIAVPAMTDETELLWLVGYLYRASRQRMEQIARTHGLTFAQIGILMTIADEPGLTGIEVADRSFITPQAAHAALTALERKGIVARTSGAARRRVVRTELTDEGARAFNNCLADLQVVGAELAVGLHDDQRTEILELMRSWIEHRQPLPGFDSTIDRRDH
jgi:DNA-binding MarR family transcriptional regulator